MLLCWLPCAEGSVLRLMVDTHLSEYTIAMFTTSRYLKTMQLFTLRAFLSSFLFAFFIYDISTTTSQAKQFFSDFSVWCWIGMMAYFFAITLATLEYKTRFYTCAVQNARPPLLNWVLWNLFVSCMTYQPIVLICYWVFISPLVVDSRHIVRCSLGLFFMGVEVVVGNESMHYSQWPSALGPLLLYFALIQVFGDFQYRFLDTGNQYAWCYYVGLVVASWLSFYIQTYALSVRDRKRGRVLRDKQTSCVIHPDETLRRGCARDERYYDTWGAK